MRASKGDNNSRSGGSSPVQPSLAQEQTVINMVVEVCFKEYSNIFTIIKHHLYNINSNI